MTFDQTANYTPKHRRDVEYVGRHKKALWTSGEQRLATADYRPGFIPKHCLGASSSRVARDFGCNHQHPRTLAEQIASMTPDQRRVFHRITGLGDVNPT